MSAMITPLLMLLITLTYVFGGYVPTPGGTYAWRDCIHTIPDGSHIFQQKTGAHVVLPDGKIFQVPKCDYPPIPKERGVDSKSSGTQDGWQVYTAADAPFRRDWKSFTGTFNVPSNPQEWPANDDAVIYLFTGLEDDEGFNIIQPVLQYGNGTADGGGRYWALADWWVYIDGSYLVSDVKQVNPGDIVFGNMTQTGPYTWITTAYVVSNRSISTNLTVTKDVLTGLNHAYCTLEVYNITTCDYFPKSGTVVSFTNMTLLDTSSDSPVKAKWKHEEVSNGCKAAADIKSSTEVDIVF